MGVLSLVFWALVIVISIKYLAFVLRADNQGEGGVLSLMSLATPLKPSRRTERAGLVLLGIFGASLLYGDGIITPAISVLSAMEGLGVATPGLQPYVVPITIVILVALFVFRPRHVAVVYGAGDSRADADRPAPVGSRGRQSRVRPPLLPRHRMARLRRSRIGVPGGHRR
jgi:KUP system potassium uptake protein